ARDVMHAVPMRQRLLVVSQPVAFCILELPHIWCYISIYISNKIKNPPYYITNFGVKILNKKLRLVSYTVVITVEYLKNLLLLHGQIFPVMGAVVVAIRQPAVLIAFFG